MGLSPLPTAIEGVTRLLLENLQQIADYSLRRSSGSMDQEMNVDYQRITGLNHAMNLSCSSQLLIPAGSRNKRFLPATRSKSYAMSLPARSYQRLETISSSPM